MTQPTPTPQPIPLARLKAWAGNPRSINDERFANLCASLEADPEFLELRPILATLDGTIFAGNMRFRAAQQLGWETVPAIMVDIPEQLARERALRDNAQWGEWQEDALAEFIYTLGEEGSDLSVLGFEDSELQRLMAMVVGGGDGLTDPDDVPPLPAEPITRPGDLWLLGPHRVLCGDSTTPADVAKVMNGEKARLMATDPPYLVNYDGGNHPDSHANRPETKTKNWDAYKDPATSVEFYVAFLEAALPHLIDRAPIYQWHANMRQSLVDEAWRKAGLLAHQVVVWVKSRGVLGHSHFMWQHEVCLYGWRQGKMPRLKPPANSTTVWQVDQKGEQDGIHPTQKPVELFRRPIEFHTKPGDLCFEPFLGSGTCLIAAQILERRCFAIEQEPAYVDVAVRRWEEFTGEKAVRDGTPV